MAQLHRLRRLGGASEAGTAGSRGSGRVARAGGAVGVVGVDDELARPQVHDVAIVQARLAGASAVDQQAVLGAQVLDVAVPAVGVEIGVAARDLAVLEDDVAGVGAAHQQPVGAHLELQPVILLTADLDVEDAALFCHIGHRWCATAMLQGRQLPRIYRMPSGFARRGSRPRPRRHDEHHVNDFGVECNRRKGQGSGRTARVGPSVSRSSCGLASMWCSSCRCG